MNNILYKEVHGKKAKKEKKKSKFEKTLHNYMCFVDNQLISNNCKLW